MARVIIAVIAGYVVWSAIWVGANAVLFTEATAVVESGQPYMEPGPYLGVLILSIVCSMLAGLTTAAIARANANLAVLVMAALLLVTGIAVQAGVWNLMPVWYHLAFLALLVPMSIVGGRLAPRQA